jgi:hypothetical protein
MEVLVGRWHRETRIAIIVALAALVVAGCSRTEVLPGLFCTDGLGNYPVFQVGGTPPYVITVGGSIEIAIVDVQPGPFDFAYWGVFDPDTDAEPVGIMVISPATTGTASTAVGLTALQGLPVGDYTLLIGGRAYEGEQTTGDFELVGECYRQFVLTVIN